MTDPELLDAIHDRVVSCLQKRVDLVSAMDEIMGLLEQNGRPFPEPPTLAANDE